MYRKQPASGHETCYTATWANQRHLQVVLLDHWHNHDRLRIETKGGSLKHCYVVCAQQEQTAFLHAGEGCNGAIIQHKHITAIVVLDDDDNEISHRDVSVEPTYEAKKAIAAQYAQDSLSVEEHMGDGR